MDLSDDASAEQEQMFLSPPSGAKLENWNMMTLSCHRAFFLNNCVRLSFSVGCRNIWCLFCKSRKRGALRGSRAASSGLERGVDLHFVGAQVSLQLSVPSAVSTPSPVMYPTQICPHPDPPHTFVLLCFCPFPDLLLACSGMGYCHCSP